MNSGTAAFIKIMKHPVKFRMFLFTKLPAAFFAGVRVRELDEKRYMGGHAMSVIGYDDIKFDGTFQIMNSWGSE